MRRYRYLGLSILSLVIWQWNGLAQSPMSLGELKRLGREASEGGSYDSAIRYFRLAINRAETDKVSGGDLALALADLAEVLRGASEYDEAEKLFDRAIQILRTDPSSGRDLAVILANQGPGFMQKREGIHLPSPL